MNDTEPFIEDYYPKIDISKYESNNENIMVTSEHPIIEKENDIYNKEDSTQETLPQIKSSNFTSSIKLPPAYNYYYNPYDYYRYLKRRSNNKKTK